MVELRIKGNAGSREVQRRLKQAKQAPKVTKLLLFKVDFDEKLVQALGDLFSTNSTQDQGRKWERVYFSRCSGPIREAILSFAKSHVSEFHFFQQNDNPTTFEFQVLSNSSLMRVSFENLTISRDHAIDLAEALAGNATLQSFCLSGSQVDDEAAEALATGFQSNCHLRSIQLSGCGLTDSGVSSIVMALLNNRSLQRLSLYGNSIRSEGLAAISKLLHSHQSTLVELDISGDPHSGGLQGGLELASLLSSLRENTRLRKLVMKDCHLQDDDLTKFVEMLCSNDTLEDVDLRCNQFSPAGIKTIFAASLLHMKGLKRMKLRQGRDILHEDVRDALIEGLQGNWTLESLDMFEWESNIEYYTDLNRARRSILRDSIFLTALWPLVLERAQSCKRIVASSSSHSTENRLQRDCVIRKANVLFYFLRNVSTLLE
jgi:hypothetical protein